MMAGRQAAAIRAALLRQLQSGRVDRPQAFAEMKTKYFDRKTPVARRKATQRKERDKLNGK